MHRCRAHVSPERLCCPLHIGAVAWNRLKRERRVPRQRHQHSDTSMPMQRSVDQAQTFMETTKQSLGKSCWILPRCTAVAHGQYTKNTSDKAVLEKTACHQLTHCSDPQDRINQTNCVHMRPCGCGSHCNHELCECTARCKKVLRHMSSVIGQSGRFSLFGRPIDSGVRRRYHSTQQSAHGKKCSHEFVWYLSCSNWQQRNTFACRKRMGLLTVRT